MTLDGSQSSDADGDVLAYSWVITSQPIGSSALLSDMHTSVATFTSDTAGTYIVTLTVDDGESESIADDVIITIANHLAPLEDGPAVTAITAAQVSAPIPRVKSGIFPIGSA